MAITLETLAVGDTNYISKHNSNYTVIKDAIDALQAAQGSSSGSILNYPGFAQAMLGTNTGRLSETDSLGTDGGSAIFDIAAG